MKHSKSLIEKLFFIIIIIQKKLLKIVSRKCTDMCVARGFPMPEQDLGNE